MHPSDVGQERTIDRTSAEASLFTAWRAALLFAGLTIGLTWPQACQMGSMPPHMDSHFNMWRLAWIAHQLPSDPRHLFDANIFHPLRGTLAFSDAVLLQGLLAAPWIWAGVPVVYVTNVLVLGSFVACGLGAFLLVREITSDAAAATLAGLIFSFAPFRFDHYYHLELLWAPWVPLTLWMLHRALRSGRLADGLWAGVFFALQGLSSVYYTVFFALILAGFLPVLLVTAPAAVRRRTAGRWLTGLAIGALLLLPYARQYQAATRVVGDRDDGTITIFSAGPRHYVSVMPRSVLYGGSLGALGKPEKRLFPGVVAAGLALLALWPPVERKHLAYVLLLAIAVDGTLGHRGLLFPFLREHVPMFRGLRVPARFGMFVLLGVSVLAGLGAARLRRALPPDRGRLAFGATVALMAITVAEYAMWPMALVPVQRSPDDVSSWLRARPPGVVADLPMPTSTADMSSEARAAYRSTFHWQRMVNGYSGYYPDSYVSLWPPLAGFPDDASLATLRERGVRYVVVRNSGYGDARYRAVRRAAESRCDLVFEGTYRDDVSEAAIFTLTGPRPGCGARPAG